MVFSDVLYQPCDGMCAATSGTADEDDKYDFMLQSASSWTCTTAADRSHRLLAPWEKQPKKTRNKAVREVVDWTKTGERSTNHDEIVRDPSFMDKVERDVWDGITNQKQPFHYRLAQQYKRRALERNRQRESPTAADKEGVDDDDNDPNEPSSVGEKEAGEALGEEAGPEKAAEEEATSSEEQKAAAAKTETGMQEASKKTEETTEENKAIKKSDSAASVGRRKKRMTFPRFASFRSAGTKNSALDTTTEKSGLVNADDTEVENRDTVGEDPANTKETKKSVGVEDTKMDERSLKKQDKDSITGRRKKRMSFPRFASFRSTEPKSRVAVESTTPPLNKKSSSLNEDEAQSAEDTGLRELDLTEADSDSASSPTSTAGYLLHPTELEEKTLSLLEEIGMSPSSAGSQANSGDNEKNAGFAADEEESVKDRALDFPSLSSASTPISTSELTTETNLSKGGLELEKKTQSVLEEIGSVIGEQQKHPAPDISSKAVGHDVAEGTKGQELEGKTQSVLEEIGSMMDQQQQEPEPSISSMPVEQEVVELDSKTCSKGHELEEKTRSVLEEIGSMMDQQQQPDPSISRATVERDLYSDVHELEEKTQSLLEEVVSVAERDHQQQSAAVEKEGSVKDLQLSDGLEIELDREQEVL